MSGTKLQKKLPKRVSNPKAAARRQRSWAHNQLAKQQRIADNDQRHANNVRLGCTGKQRRYNPNHSEICGTSGHVMKTGFGYVANA